MAVHRSNVRSVQLVFVVAVATIAAFATPVSAQAVEVQQPVQPALKVASYNVSYMRHTDTATVKAALLDADIIMYQETNARWQRVLTGLDEAGFAYRKFVHNKGARGNGIAIASKLPLGNVRTFQAKGMWGPALIAVVTTPLGAVQIINVHLRPPYDKSWLKGYLTTQAKRLAEIKALHAALDPTLPTIIAGDFNETSDGDAMKWLATKSLAAAPATGSTTWHLELYQGVNVNLAMSIDHILLSPELRATANVLDIGNSDHRPVVATVSRATNGAP